MRARTLVLALAGLGAAGATAGLLAQHGNYGVNNPGASGSTALVMTYNGPTGMPTNEEGQPPKLPPLPAGVTLDMIRQGDAIFHGVGGCYTCHGPEATGMPDKGSALTDGVSFEQDTWPALDSTITTGISEPVTRVTIAMPARGVSGNLTPQQVQQVAAYVWAISTTRGEPWPGGHQTHAAGAAPAATAPQHGTGH